MGDSKCPRSGDAITARPTDRVSASRRRGSGTALLGVTPVDSQQTRTSSPVAVPSRAEVPRRISAAVWSASTKARVLARADSRPVDLRRSCAAESRNEIAGSESWSFRHRIAQLPHAAVYVRDVTGLEPPPDPVLPPPLGVPDDEWRDVLDEAGRAAAGAQWLRWWRGLAVAEAVERGSPGEVIRHSFWPGDDGRIAGLGPGDQSALQRAVAAAFDSGRSWLRRCRSPVPETGGACFEWHLVRDVAEDVARRHGVSPGAVRGTAVELRVEGNWWAGLGSGVTACSVACAQDPQTARDVLLEAFESGLSTRR
jgi:hypothetical protein